MKSMRIQLCWSCKHFKERRQADGYMSFCELNGDPIYNIKFVDKDRERGSSSLNPGFRLPENCPYILEHAVL